MKFLPLSKPENKPTKKEHVLIFKNKDTQKLKYSMGCYGKNMEIKKLFSPIWSHIQDKAKFIYGEKTSEYKSS